MGFDKLRRQRKPRNPLRSREETTSSCMVSGEFSDIITSNFECHTYFSFCTVESIKRSGLQLSLRLLRPSAILARHSEHFMPLDFRNVRHNEIGQAYAHQFCAPQSDR